MTIKIKMAGQVNHFEQFRNNEIVLSGSKILNQYIKAENLKAGQEICILDYWYLIESVEIH